MIISPFLSNAESIEYVDCKKYFYRMETKKYTRFDELEYNELHGTRDSFRLCTQL